VDAEQRSASEPEVLTPPAFAACVQRLKEEPATPEDIEAGPSKLRQECHERYRGAQEQALESLIATVWVLEGARELGTDPRGLTAIAELERDVRGGTTIDPQLGSRAKREVETINAAVARRVKPVSSNEVAVYYARHRDKFAAKEELRDVELAKTDTEAKAYQVKQELAGGKAFAQVVKESGVREADYAKEGLAIELRSDTYGEPSLNRAMFAARPNVLSGPVGTTFGWFVFEVKRIRPARYKPLRSVAASIRAQLTRDGRHHALIAFVEAWQAKWTARTSCRTGYVVRGCHELRGTGGQPPNALYALDQ
jgi:hypothetical protein